MFLSGLCSTPRWGWSWQGWAGSRLADWFIQSWCQPRDAVCQPNLENIYTKCLTLNITHDSWQRIFSIETFPFCGRELCAIVLQRMKVIQKDLDYWHRNYRDTLGTLGFTIVRCYIKGYIVIMLSKQNNLSWSRPNMYWLNTHCPFLIGERANGRAEFYVCSLNIDFTTNNF